MPLEIFVSRRAAREIERVVQWWASNRPAAPGAVRQDLQASLNLLLMQPDIGVRVKGRRGHALTRLTRRYGNKTGVAIFPVASSARQAGPPSTPASFAGARVLPLALALATGNAHRAPAIMKLWLMVSRDGARARLC